MNIYSREVFTSAEIRPAIFKFQPYKSQKIVMRYFQNFHNTQQNSRDAHDA